MPGPGSPQRTNSWSRKPHGPAFSDVRKTSGSASASRFPQNPGSVHSPSLAATAQARLASYLHAASCELAAR